jgi:microcystin synthetase protein McyA
MISKCKQHGLEIQPRQIFEHQTIHELSAVVQWQTNGVSAEQGMVSGDVGLTPIHHWFFEQKLHHPQHFNQSVVLNVSKELNEEFLWIVVEHWLKHHDILRLKVSLDEPRIHINEFEGFSPVSAAVSAVDLSHYNETEFNHHFKRLADELQKSLSLTQVDLIRTCLVKSNDSESNRLLIVIHHLAVDGVSWRILFEDFILMYEQYKKELPITLPPKTTSFLDWSSRLQDYAKSEEVQSELPYWQNILQTKTKALPTACVPDPNKNTVASVHEISRVLDEELTGLLLHEVHETYNTRINDLLISALVLTLSDWTNESAFHIDLESHGREDLFDDVDISRTVGWFTSLYPMLFQFDSYDHSYGSIIRTVKEQIRSIPNHGLGYGLLQYMHSGAQTVLPHPSPSNISFNYLGTLDQDMVREPLKGMSYEESGAMRNAEQLRSHWIEAGGYIVQNQLNIVWMYSKEFFTEECMQQNANAYMNHLKAIIEHCCVTGESYYTPSDFPLAEIDQSTLDALLR